ncbi:MAG TPA: hypothetical protein VGM56_20230 [Byssovorax sp.]|jgi:hypothetical protein
MSSSKAARVRGQHGEVRALRRVEAGASTATSSPALPALATARVVSVDGRAAEVEVGGVVRAAALDAPVHTTVVAGACERGERVLVEARGAELVIVGALRTQPTPGIDEGERYVVKAASISIEATDEVQLTTGAAAFVLRAAGEVETYAQRIVSRAEGMHKMVARLLRLN